MFDIDGCRALCCDSRTQILRFRGITRWQTIVRWLCDFARSLHAWRTIVVWCPYHRSSLLRWSHASYANRKTVPRYIYEYITSRANTTSTSLGPHFILIHACRTLVARLTEDNCVVYVRWVNERSTMCLWRVNDGLILRKSYDYHTTPTWLYIVKPSWLSHCFRSVIIYLGNFDIAAESYDAQI